MKKAGKKGQRSFSIVIQLIAIMYIVQIFNILNHGEIRQYGIHPRNLETLWGVLTAPFIHSSWSHLFNNTLSFAVFSSLCLMKGPAYYLKSSFFIIVVGGGLVWAFARPASHIGASGWIFGLWSLIIATAWFERSILNILLSLGMMIFYGGMILGVLPVETHVSFESHLFGAIAGVIAASIFTDAKSR